MRKAMIIFTLAIAASSIYAQIVSGYRTETERKTPQNSGVFSNVRNTGTYYYKQVKIVSKDKKEQVGNGKGQFITFTHKGCYDSNKEGYKVDNGFVEYKGNANGYHTFYGSSYWGTATYYFMTDYSRLNILIEATGITYVYTLATAPANVLTSALIKEKMPAPTPNPTPTPVNPIIVNPVNPIDGYNNNRTSTRRTCPGCNGKGKGMDQITYSPNYTGGSNDKYCGQCGRTGPAHTHHAPMCRTCNGKGYIE